MIIKGQDSSFQETGHGPFLNIKIGLLGEGKGALY